MAKIKVSIIIPVYNAEDTIELCLKSLNNQNYSVDEYEIITVDDGSTDKSLNIIKKYKSKVVLKCISQKNSGPALARNKGAELALGEIVIFTDSDCELDFNWLKEMTKPFKDQNIGGVQGRYITKQTALASIYEQIDIEGRYEKMKRYNYINFIGTYSAAYRKDIFIKLGGFNTDYKKASGEDFEFSNKVSLLGYDMYFAENAICYHKHPESFLTYFKTKYNRGIWRVLLYKNSKETILKDSYSSLTMKIQFVMVSLILLTIFLGSINHFFLYFSLIFLISYVLLCIPFIRFSLTKDFRISLVYPFVNFVRSIFFTSGIIVGIYKIIFNNEIK